MGLAPTMRDVEEAVPLEVSPFQYPVDLSLPTAGSPARPRHRSSRSLTDQDPEAPWDLDGAKGVDVSAAKKPMYRKAPASEGARTPPRNAGQESGAQTPIQREAADSAVERAAKVKEALDRFAIFESSDVGNTDEPSQTEVKCLRKKMVMMLTFFAVAAGILAVGLVMQNYLKWALGFRWCYFAAGVPIIWYSCHYLSKGFFRALEVYIFNEFLAHYEALINATRNTVAGGIMFFWYVILFYWSFCGGDYSISCENPYFAQSRELAARVLACIAVGSVANLLAAIATKMVSTHFYKSTHFQKLQEALQKEFQLKALSKPRVKAEPTKPPKARRDSKAWSVGEYMTLPHLKRDSSDGKLHSKALKDGSQFVGGMSLDVPVRHHDYHSKPPRASSISDTGSDYGYDEDESRIDSPSQSSSNLSSAGSWNRGNIQLDMDRDMLGSLPLEMLDKTDEGIDEMSDQDIERLRTTVVIKTYSSLIKQHNFRTTEDLEKQIKEVRRFGSALFSNVRGGNTHRMYFTIEDVKLFYKNDKAGLKQAEAAFAIFSSDPRERIRKEQVVEAVVSLFKARSNIAASLSNTQSMMSTLEGGLAGTLHFVFIGFYMLIWEVDVLQGFSSLFAAILALSFIFGRSIQNIYEAMLFLFVQHPFDVGDCILANDVFYEIKRINLLHTIVTDKHGQPVTLLNPDLQQKTIVNLSRAKTYTEHCNVLVDVGVANNIKTVLHSRLVSHMKNKSTEFDNSLLDVKYSGLEQVGLKIRIFLIWRYAIAADDFGRLRAARDGAMQVVTDTLAEFKADGAVYTFMTKNSGRSSGIGSMQDMHDGSY